MPAPLASLKLRPGPQPKLAKPKVPLAPHNALCPAFPTVCVSVWILIPHPPPPIIRLGVSSGQAVLLGSGLPSTASGGCSQGR